MTADEEERAWQRACARQAASDLDVYELLCRETGLPSCHRLHYLQMALEKMAKAYAWDPDQREQRSPEFARSHAVASKVMPAAFREHWRVTTPSPGVLPRGRAARSRCRRRRPAPRQLRVPLGGRGQRRPTRPRPRGPPLRRRGHGRSAGSPAGAQVRPVLAH